MLMQRPLVHQPDFSTFDLLTAKWSWPENRDHIHGPSLPDHIDCHRGWGPSLWFLHTHTTHFKLWKHSE